jgi:hypothetical protein
MLPITQEIAGFFIIESHVMRTTKSFRAERDVEELWEEAIRRVKEGIQDALRTEKDHELFIAVKDHLLVFAMTMEVRRPFLSPSVNSRTYRAMGIMCNHYTLPSLRS